MASIPSLFLVNRLLCSPLDILFTLLVFILGKNTDALPFQITIITCIKPISAFFSFYTSSLIFNNPQRIKPYLLLNNLIGCSTCFFYPFVENVWFYIISYAFFMVTTRAAYPAWIEILKRTLDKSALSKLISQGTSTYYLISISLPPLICSLMDKYETLWSYLFMGLACLQLLNMILILFIKIDIKIPHVKSIPATIPFLEPLKNGWKLLKEKSAFTHYLLLFTFTGVGIIASHCVLPLYFKENLDLSFTQLGLAFSFCKGVSFILTSPYWARLSHRISLYHINCLMNVFNCLFFAFLMAANSNIQWLYVAFIFYGTGLAGCEISWNVSAPFFSGTKESTLYSGLNLAFIGIRGCICPLLGYLVFVHVGAFTVFWASIVICLIGIIYGLWIDRRYSPYSPAKPQDFAPETS
jgi:hypothetical protein